MRWAVYVAVVGVGCNAIYEDNPEYDRATTTGVTSATVTGAASSAASASTSTSTSTSTSETPASSSGDDTGPPAECGTDMYEPNDSRGESANLGGITTETPPSMLLAQLDDTADEDWWKLPGEVLGGAIANPRISVDAPIDLSVCVYVACSEGEPIPTCEAGEPDTANGSPGCCGTNMGSVSYTCEGSVDDSGFAYPRITSLAPLEQCVPYRMTYSY